VKEPAVDTKTRAIDFETLGLRDALDLATLIEQEAKDRYSELADQMDIHHNPEAARFFRYMLQVESTHESQLAERRRSMFGATPRVVRREMIFDVEAPDYDEARHDMTVHDALGAALRAEEKAFAFFDAALPRVKDPTVRDLFEKLREEEREHREYVMREIAKLPPEASIDAGAFEDDPVAH
jgi:rubrerythrin